MKVIVDAYNVLYTNIKKDLIEEHERKHLINLLVAYAQEKQHTVIVVFDAGEFLFPMTNEHRGVIIKYSGPQYSADDIILKYIKEHVGHSMVLVSSDRPLCAAAKFYGVEAVQAQDFFELLKQQSEPASVARHNVPVVKMGESNQDVDLLMLQTQVQKKVDDLEPVTRMRKSPSHTLSKKERKRMYKIKKL